MVHVLNVEMGSKGESRLNELLEVVGENAVTIKKMISNGVVYNEFVITQDTYDKIRNYLLKEESK